MIINKIAMTNFLYGIMIRLKSFEIFEFREMSSHSQWLAAL